MAAKKAVGKSVRASKAKTKDVGATPVLKAIADKQTKSEIILAIAEQTGLSKKQVVSVFSTLSQLIVRHMKKRGSGQFAIPETGVKIIRKTRPATKKRMGRNPATGEALMIPAKPARTVVKITALKSLKETVNH